MTLSRKHINLVNYSMACPDWQPDTHPATETLAKFIFFNNRMVAKMIDFMLSLFSAVFQMNMRDHHDMPFALPLVMFACTGFVIAFIILKFIGDEEQDDEAQTTITERSTDRLS